VIQVGLVGVGHWGPNVVRSLEAGGRARVEWLCDLDDAALQRMSARHTARTTNAFEDLIADDGLDAIAIATPVGTHFELAKRALEVGKHVLLEKPMTATAAEGRDLIRIAEEASRVLMVGHVFEYNATIQALKELIDDGELGEVQYMSFARTNLGPVRTDVNAFWDLASHDVSIMTYFLGQAPSDVTARGQAWLNADVEDAVFATFGFPSGVLAHVEVSWLNPRKVRLLTIVGDKKMAVWDDLALQNPIQIFDRHVALPEVSDTYLEHKTAVVDGGVFIPSIRLNQPLATECEHFLDCVESGARPRTDGKNGLRVVMALEAASASMRNGSAITTIEPVA
jgi:predicted dehydrogenase